MYEKICPGFDPAASGTTSSGSLSYACGGDWFQLIIVVRNLNKRTLVEQRLSMLKMSRNLNDHVLMTGLAP